MKTRRYIRAAGFGLAAVFLAAAAVYGQFSLARRSPVKRPSVAEGAFAAFGAFRSLAAEVVWFRAGRLQEEGRFTELAQLARALTLSEPHTPEVWSYAAWNLAYNVSVMMPEPAERWRWVYTAMRLLRDEGLKLNPGAPELYRELAWLFEFKLGLSTDAAQPYYRERWREIVEDVALRGAWAELGMDPAIMTAMEKKLSLSDRTDPFYSAVYFAELGLQHAKGADRAFLEEIVRQSLRLHSRML